MSFPDAIPIHRDSFDNPLCIRLIHRLAHRIKSHGIEFLHFIFAFSCLDQIPEDVAHADLFFRRHAFVSIYQQCGFSHGHRKDKPVVHFIGYSLIKKLIVRSLGRIYHASIKQRRT